jgi:hypothetical protein
MSQPPHPNTPINMSRPSQTNSTINHSNPSQSRTNFPSQGPNSRISNPIIPERNGFQMAKLPIVNTRNMQVDRPPLNTINRPNTTPKTSHFTPKRAASSTQALSQPNNLPLQAMSRPPSIPAPPLKPAQQPADVQSLLDGINPEDLFDDF